MREFDERSIEGALGPLELLQDYIAVWLLLDPDCVGVTGGDYTNFLQAILIIVGKHSQDPTVLEHCLDTWGTVVRRRPLKGLIDVDGALYHYLSREVYQQVVFRHLTGRAES